MHCLPTSRRLRRCHHSIESAVIAWRLHFACCELFLWPATRPLMGAMNAYTGPNVVVRNARKHRRTEDRHGRHFWANWRSSIRWWEARTVYHHDSMPGRFTQISKCLITAAGVKCNQTAHKQHIRHQSWPSMLVPSLSHIKISHQ